MSSTDGATILARALVGQGVEYVFGIVGYPVTELGITFQAEGLKFVHCHNEQAASYAASAIGYLTGRPAVCLVVAGPAVVHALAGMSNAMENCWPLIVIGGAAQREQEGMGAFQEYPQVDIARPFCKYSVRPSSIGRIPFYVEKAVRHCIYGRPGVSYIDMPADMITGQTAEENVLSIPYCPSPPKTFADPQNIQQTVDLLTYADKPLVIIGKGAAYGRAEKVVQQLVTSCQFPFLPTPMGKGVIADDHHLCVASVRTKALQEADVVLLLGARLNWILHFGLPPRFNPKVKIIQVDIHAEDLGNNARHPMCLHGDIEAVVGQLVEEFNKRPGRFQFSSQSPWWKTLRAGIQANQQTVKKLASDTSVPLNYYAPLQVIQDLLPKDTIIINEGSNTMDIGRTMLPNFFPRHRLDAGSFGTMGVGLGFTLAAALWCRDHAPNKRVVCVSGDSAFGFSGMETETILRYNLPVTIIVLNNNGVAFGVSKEDWKAFEEAGDLTLTAFPMGLKPGVKFEKMMEALGGRGYEINTVEELRKALTTALADRKSSSLLHVLLDPKARRKVQEFPWLTKSKV